MPVTIGPLFPRAPHNCFPVTSVRLSSDSLLSRSPITQLPASSARLTLPLSFACHQAACLCCSPATPPVYHATMTAKPISCGLSSSSLLIRCRQRLKIALKWRGKFGVRDLLQRCVRRLYCLSFSSSTQFSEHKYKRVMMLHKAPNAIICEQFEKFSSRSKP